MKSVFALIIPIVVAGCVSTPERMASTPDLDVCMSYGIYRTGILAGSSGQYYEEMTRRELLTGNDVSLVQNKQIQRGMSQCALYASWGKPDKENRTVFAGGIHIQHIYNTGYRNIKRSYVYTENGRVTSWQD